MKKGLLEEPKLEKCQPTFYARRGIITPEMEYIAIRENIIRNSQVSQEDVDLEREERLIGQPLGAKIPEVIILSL